MRRLLLLGLFLFPCIGFSQTEAEAPAEVEESASENVLANVQSLEALLKSIRSKEAEVAVVREKLVSVQDEVTRKSLTEQLEKLQEEASGLSRQFVEFSVEVDVRPFIEEEEAEFDWKEKLSDLLKPIVSEFENATADSRAIGKLRNNLDRVTRKYELAKEAVVNLERLADQNPSPELEAKLNEELALWTRWRDGAKNEKTALQIQLDSRLAAKKSLIDTVASFAENFFQTRGFNLLLGVGAFCLVFFGMRLLRYLIRRARRNKRAKSFGSRLGTLIVEVSSVFGGLMAALVVFNLAGDWFLLGIIFIFLLGIGWASINTLPQHIETVKLMLNVGMVREGERLVFDGVPWKVETLGINAKLVNPLLAGGVQHFPVKHLVGMTSRPFAVAEEWFPSKKDDWVELADGRIGKVEYQTPSSVQLVELGGSRIIYQTESYLANNPRTLSNDYRIRSTFGVDYQHQAISTTEIPAKMKKKLEEELPKLMDKEDLLGVHVEFLSAAASSLDYEVMIDLKGTAASLHETIQRAIQRILVDACNENNWTIPFTQLTIHQE